MENEKNQSKLADGCATAAIGGGCLVGFAAWSLLSLAVAVPAGISVLTYNALTGNQTYASKPDKIKIPRKIRRLEQIGSEDEITISQEEDGYYVYHNKGDEKNLLGKSRVLPETAPGFDGNGYKIDVVFPQIKTLLGSQKKVSIGLLPSYYNRPFEAFETAHSAAKTLAEKFGKYNNLPVSN